MWIGSESMWIGLGPTALPINVIFSSFDFSNSEYIQYIRYGKWAELVLFRGENMIPKGGGREYIFNVNKTSSCGYRWILLRSYVKDTNLSSLDFIENRNWYLTTFWNFLFFFIFPYFITVPMHLTVRRNKNFHVNSFLKMLFLLICSKLHRTRGLNL